jgi:hypothetical protein
MTKDEALAILHDHDQYPVDSSAYDDAFEAFYGYRPVPEEKPVKKAETTKLDKYALYNIAEAMENSETNSVGTFHLPDFDNIKVKFDKESGEHYIVARLL